jgi:hypothetical protein
MCEISLVDWRHLVSKDLLCQQQSHSMGEDLFVLGRLSHVLVGHFCTSDTLCKVLVLPLWHFAAWIVKCHGHCISQATAPNMTKGIMIPFDCP